MDTLIRAQVKHTQNFL